MSQKFNLQETEIESQFRLLKMQKEFETIKKNAYLSKYGYVIKKDDLSSDEMVHIKTELRARPLQDDKYIFNGNDISFPIYIETQNKIYLPKFYGIKRYGKPDKEMANYNGQGWEHEIEFTGTLYEKQIAPANKLIESCYKDGGGILQLNTGFGKTFLNLYVLSKLRGKALIIVNKIPLMKQWINEIKQFLPNARVGTIQGQKNVDINDKDIIVAMLQSLSKIDYPDTMFHDIRVVTIDEIHNTASKMFSKVFTKLCSKWTIGLSATPKRADGCEYVFQWHIGDIVYKSQIERAGKQPIVQMIKINSTEYKEISTINRITGQTQIQFTSMLSELIEMKKRNELVITLIKKLTSEGRKILVLSDRRAHLITLRDILSSKNERDFTYGLFLGSMKQKDLDKSRASQVILATYASFSEGVSERDLDTLLLITPKKFVGHIKSSKKADNGKIEQIVGRIFRKEHIERNPMIIDLHDNFSVYKTQGNSRKVFYKEHFTKMIYEEYIIDLDKSDEIQLVKRTDVKKENDKEFISNDDDKNEKNISNYCMLD